MGPNNSTTLQKSDSRLLLSSITVPWLAKKELNNSTFFNKISYKPDFKE